MELGTWCKMNHAITNYKYVCTCACVCVHIECVSACVCAFICLFLPMCVCNHVFVHVNECVLVCADRGGVRDPPHGGPSGPGTAPSHVGTVSLHPGPSASRGS